ncbi:hypothetical protein [Aliikangiella sp. IMCC44359]|uniref:hypothetical protein n=1 Tax=Aliikangiella sp. IMCC44359 TaxID=3459125 RepID=UPI00403AFCAB
MKQPNPLLEYCQSICEGDGISPRHEKSKEKSINYDNRRLCRQVQKLSQLAISELGLDNWSITHVKQKPNKSSLLLIIEPIATVSLSDCEHVINWLDTHKGKIRSIVANGINRKTVPALTIKLADEKDYE